MPATPPAYSGQGAGIKNEQNGLAQASRKGWPTTCSARIIVLALGDEGVDALARRAREFLDLVIAGIQAPANEKR